SATGGVLVTGLRRVLEFREPRSPLFRLAHQSALVHWRTELKSIADLLAPANRLGSIGLWTDGGHQTGHYQRTAEIDRQVVVTPAEVSFDFSSLIGLTEGAMDRDVQVVLLAEPTSCDSTGRCVTAGGVAMLRAAYRGLAAELGIPFLEIEGSWPMEWYADAAHFNRQGTVAYTTELVAALQELDL
ncbi:MAG TPA: hypothetical protein VMS74_12445, partial [Acidimicrobiia bacterium]|nr:hypothetical protein [Acidimicrobiia bacterium]